VEATPTGISYEVVKNTFLSVDRIKQIHNLRHERFLFDILFPKYKIFRIWGMTTDKTALAAHLGVGHGYDAQQVLQEATVKIRAKYDLYAMTLQVEEFQQDMDDCGQCKVPSR
jgi:zinc transporter 2